MHVPAALRQYAAGARVVSVEVPEQCTVERAFECLSARAPGVVERVLDERRRVRPHINVFVDGESIRLGASRGLQTPLAPNADLWILPAVSGGA